MAVETLFAQMSHEALCTSEGGGTTLLPCCCVCGLIRDETSTSHAHERWVTQGTYRKIHGVKPSDCGLTHTYCPECFIQVRNRIRAA